MSGVLGELGLREADLGALMRDAPERSLFEQCYDEELAEEEREAAAPVATGRRRREPTSVTRRREIEARIAELRNPKTGGGPKSWEEVITELGKDGLDPAEIAAMLDVHRASVREGGGSRTDDEMFEAVSDELARRARELSPEQWRELTPDQRLELERVLEERDGDLPDGTELPEGTRLSEAELLTAEPILEEPALTLAERGEDGGRSLFEWDGQTEEHVGKTVKLAVIRPCVSRGKRIRGLPPIYTPEMLAENAAVYTGWLMYADHVTEGRSIKEIGGRIIRSWWEPNFTTPRDDAHGWRPGAVLAEALPQPFVRSMLEADPDVLNVSHNAWPTAARVGTMWGRKGAVIEGIRSKPEGSVDWVARGGAGGHVLREAAADGRELPEPGAGLEEALGLSGDEAVEALREALYG